MSFIRPPLNPCVVVGTAASRPVSVVQTSLGGVALSDVDRAAIAAAELDRLSGGTVRPIERAAGIFLGGGGDRAAVGNFAVGCASTQAIGRPGVRDRFDRRIIVVGGTFDDRGGEPSVLVSRLHEALPEGTPIINGGQYDRLPEITESLVPYDIVLWFPNIPNDKPKLRDKRDIGPSSFVAVQMDSFRESRISYLGDRKPSVDAPSQTGLLAILPEVNYILHTHVYIDGAPTTRRMIPCGSPDEVDEIMQLIGHETGRSNFAVNLLGHGSLVFARDLNFLERGFRYAPRPQPEPLNPDGSTSKTSSSAG